MPYVIKREPLGADHKSVYLKTSRSVHAYTDSLDYALVFASHHQLLSWVAGNMDPNLGGDKLHIVEVKEGGWVEVK